MQAERPINLDLTKFRFPPMAIVSILHRVSGVILFLLIPLMLYLLHHTLVSVTSFTAIQEQVSVHLLMKLGVWLTLSAAAFHLLSGIRHIIMDFGFGETARAGRYSAYLVFALALVAVILLGIWLW